MNRWLDCDSKSFKRVPQMPLSRALTYTSYIDTWESTEPTQCLIYITQAVKDKRAKEQTLCCRRGQLRNNLLVTFHLRWTRTITETSHAHVPSCRGSSSYLYSPQLHKHLRWFHWPSGENQCRSRAIELPRCLQYLSYTSNTHLNQMHTSLSCYCCIPF